MAKIVRKTQQIFAGSAANVGEFGSLQAGTKLLSTDPAAIQTSAWVQGLNDAIVSGQDLIALEELNGIHLVETYQLAYLFQEGIPEYDAGTTYFIGSIVKQTGTSRLYKSIIDNNTGNALTNGSDWLFLQDLANPESTIFWCGTATGTANALILSPTNAMASYAAGNIVMFIPASANTAATTINVSTLGNKNITKGTAGNTSLVVNDLTAGKIAFAIYDGTEFQLINPPAFAHGADVASAATLVLDGTGGDILNITGTTGITAVTLAEGRFKICKFSGIVTLTYGASLLLNTNSSNYTTAANDVIYFYGLASGVVVGTIIPANGQSPVTNPQNLVYGSSVGGTANAITVTTTPNLTALTAGQSVIFLPTSTSTSAATINVDGLGVKNITKAGNLATVANDIITGVATLITYDGTQWQLDIPHTFAQGPDIAAAQPLVLDGNSGNLINITGTATISNITLRIGDFKICRFASAGSSIVYAGGNILTNAGASTYTVSAGDVVIFYAVTAGIIALIFPSSGLPVVSKGTAKAWVNFVGSSGSINKAYNVSSVTRNSTGNYTIAFTSAMSDVNYCMLGSLQMPIANGFSMNIQNGTTPATGSCIVECYNSNSNAAADPTLGYCAFFD